MATFELPLSGNINQAIWTAFMSPMNDQVGVINVNLGQSSDPDVEKQILLQVGSYGRQLGRLTEAVSVLVKHYRPKKELSRKERAALDDFMSMAGEIARIRKAHRTEAASPADTDEHQPSG